MDANLTRYDCDSSCQCGRFGDEKMRECSDGVWVKFADVKESLSTSHNSAMVPCLCDSCHIDNCPYSDNLRASKCDFYHPAQRQ